MLRIAVIGAGSIGRRHIGNLLSMGCDVYVYEPDAGQRERMKALYTEARVFGLMGGDESFDAMVIASPHETHLFTAELAAQRNIPFFVEKPIGTLAEIGAWRRLAAATAGLTTQVGYQLRFHPALRFLREQFKEPTAGGFYCDVNMATWPGKSYGPWLLECSHEIDAALFCGAPTTVTGGELHEQRADIVLGDRWILNIDSCADIYWRHWSLHANDSRMTVSWDSAEALGSLMYYDEMLHFIECVREGRQTDCPLSEGVKVLEVCQQVEQMARKAA